jgi:hypothetical protein
LDCRGFVHVRNLHTPKYKDCGYGCQVYKRVTNYN